MEGLRVGVVGRAADGKGYVVAGGIVGAALIGLVGFVIPMLYAAASGG